MQRRSIIWNDTRASQVELALFHVTLAASVRPGLGASLSIQLIKSVAPLNGQGVVRGIRIYVLLKKQTDLSHLLYQIRRAGGYEARGSVPLFFAPSMRCILCKDISDIVLG
jgi:hypothetical protein